MHLSGTVMEIWCLKDMYTDTHTDTTMDTHNDGQNDQSHNLLQCSLCSHLAVITRHTLDLQYAHSIKQ